MPSLKASDLPGGGGELPALGTGSQTGPGEITAFYC